MAMREATVNTKFIPELDSAVRGTKSCKEVVFNDHGLIIQMSQFQFSFSPLHGVVSNGIHVV